MSGWFSIPSLSSSLVVSSYRHSIVRDVRSGEERLLVSLQISPDLSTLALMDMAKLCVKLLVF